MTAPMNIELERAVNERNCNEIKILLAAGADIDHTVNQYLDTMLHKAKNAGIARDLLGYGANVNAKNLFDQTPLHLAVIEGKQAEIVKTLLEHAPDVNAKDSKGLTPLHYGVKSVHKNVEIIKYLIFNNADINFQHFNFNELSPLSTGMLQDDLTGVKALIKYALLKNFQDSFTNVIDLRAYYRMKNFLPVRMYLNECGSEILKMKSEKMSAKVTLFQMVKSNYVPCELLYKDPKSMELFTKKSFEVLAGNSYPQYHDIIVDKLRSKLQVATLRNILNMVQISSINLDSNRKQHASLNQDTISVLAKYLTKNDLFNLILASFEPIKLTKHDVLKRTLVNISGHYANAPISKRRKLTSFI